ncbi:MULTISPECIES: hypothetical protein [Caballeronia]|jgi:hypothetical protein|uniref:Uncharacterized protein n=2 Tax=Caballeronia TaxID=1827195 RepID=A0ACB5QTR1_9BURK|nr:MULTISPECIES: hypothetical protein [Caballeronia]MBC8641453.1 hypothetical protein [Caballeronia sp. EK]GJH10403.1 hypothetical protein CBA19CS11_16215 [Caballeronia novacaledonica]GJH18326.1 hypothetical protein CBA19CS22_17310 [Caballeronia novacaledonica]
MYQTMEGNARPHRTAECFIEGSQVGAAATQAELLQALQSASDNIMRLAGKLRGERDATADDAETITEQHALAQELIGRLLALPASQA